MLTTLSNRFKFKLATGQTLRFLNAVTRSLFTCQELQLSRTRFNSTSASKPSLDFHSTYKLTLPPNPAWNVGDGLTDNDHMWKDIMASKRKSWDFTKLESLSTKDSYRTLVSAIVPRPIALVSTQAKDGNVPNLAPFSYFSMVSHRPPLISISFSLSPRRPKDTRNNILATREFTISIISEGFAEAANSTSVESPADTDEWLISGLTKENSDIVKPPFVRESAVAMECEDISVPGSEVPTVTVVLGLIKKLHVREAVLCEDGITVDPAKLRPVARLGGTTYGRLLEGFDLPRPSWRELRDEYPKLPRP
uniref:Flavin reductase like domain-containing protein n=1 Tax=Psilocybe cubensis TaxID=181762 RepID=A0A8H7Y5K9_PSICU